VRVIIPGWIGGRMVKWLTKIIITDKESDNYYHFFDNRILPPQVDKDTTKS
jgi:nitrate reductase (NAD(P)H)